MNSKSEKSLLIEDVIQQLRAGTSMPAELMEIFSEEADDHLRTIYDGLGRLKEQNDDATALADVRRAAHTLKGAAGAVSLKAATQLAHRMEDLLDQLSESGIAITKKQLKLVLTTADQLQELTTSDFDVELAAGQIVSLYEAYSGELGDSSGPAAATKPKNQSKTATADSTAVDANPVSTASASESNSPAAGTKYLRVPLQRLDDLVGFFGEMMVNRSEFQQQLDDFESRIEDMQNALARLRSVAHRVDDQLGTDSKIHSPATAGDPSGQSSERQKVSTRTNSHDEFDPLEFEQYGESYLWQQTLSEADNDAEMMSAEFWNVKSSFDALLRRQKQLNREAQKSLMRIRMVPLSGIVSRLERTVRTVSGKVGRPVELEVIGERIELDKTVLDEITDPLLHLIRNAIDHGVETADVRAAAGKPETANLRLRAINHGTQVTLQVADDGGGINLEKVRQKAIAQKLITADEKLADDELYALIFRPGFSTAAELTDVSGRGVGMDVVGDAIRRLKGTIRVESESGVGTTFTIQLPTTLGLTRAVIVESAGRKFAIPVDTIQQVQRLDPSAVETDGTDSMTRLGDRDVRLIDLSEHLQLQNGESAQPFQKPTPLLMLRNADDFDTAITVDSIIGSRDIVVKSLGEHLKRVRGIIGATLDGDGSVVPILDTTDFGEKESADLLSASHYDVSRQPVKRNRAMVVDDSLSVRRVTENLLKSAGWDVVTAKDGVDALEKIADLDTVPDLFLCDMEMPRMNGIELIRQIRDQPEFETTPIVMVTSRASEKHRHKAYDAGATDYVVKPYNDVNLLELITQLVQAAHETVGS